MRDVAWLVDRGLAFYGDICELGLEFGIGRAVTRATLGSFGGPVLQFCGGIIAVVTIEELRARATTPLDLVETTGRDVARAMLRARAGGVRVDEIVDALVNAGLDRAAAKAIVDDLLTRY